MIRHRFDYRQNIDDMEFNDEASMTEPGQSMTNSEYVKKFSMGVPVYAAAAAFDEGHYYDNEDETVFDEPLDGFLDPAERDAISRDFEAYSLHKRAKNEKPSPPARAQKSDSVGDARETREDRSDHLSAEGA